MKHNNSDIQFEGKSERVNSLRFLDQQQKSMIDQALSSLDSFGELRLIVVKGIVRYLVTQNSFDALKCFPGDFTNVGNSKNISLNEADN